MDKDSGFLDRAKDTVGKVAGKAMDKVNQWADEVESGKAGQTESSPNRSGSSVQADGKNAGGGRPKAAGEYEYNERGTHGDHHMSEFGGISAIHTGTDARADAKPASDEFGNTPDSRKPAPPNQFSGGAEPEGIASGESRSSRYEEQEPVDGFPEDAAPSEGMTSMESGTDPQASSTNVAYGDPIGRYDGHEEDILNEEERQSRYEEQEPVGDFLGDGTAEEPPEPFGDAGRRPI